jgi:ABC-type multidrug transport system ATPase subunit
VSEPAAPLVELTEVGHVAGGARTLDRISLTLSAGDRLAIVGDNGSGKSTLARIAAGLIQPASGRVRLFGVDLASATQDEIRRLRSRIGVVLQGGSLIGDLPVEDNLRLGLGAVREGSLTRLRGRLDRITINFGLEHAYGRLASELSAGERRRLELARAFLREPDLLILDDPFEGADATAAADLETRLVKALRRRPIALLLLTHHQGLAERLGATIGRLHQGRLAAASASAAG